MKVLAILIVAAVLIAATASVWGWLFMLIAGSGGWHVGFWPTSFLMGVLFASAAASNVRS